MVNCKECGKPFERGPGQQAKKYCSDACFKAVKRRKVRDYKRDKALTLGVDKDSLKQDLYVMYGPRLADTGSKDWRDKFLRVNGVEMY